MHCILNQRTDPAFNLAAEEYLLRHREAEFFMLGRNTPSVILGRNQNAWAEVNLSFVEASGLIVLRRMSGGGAVYHDLGNVNFTYIKSNPSGPKVDFERFTDRMVEALREMGVHSKFEGRNSLMVAGRKVSGNAQYLYKNRVLHHGTLLFSTDLGALDQALQGRASAYRDRAIKSVPSQVANLVDFLPEPTSVEAFMQRLMAFHRGVESDATAYDWTPDDLTAIDALRRARYESWDWNIGYAPDYSYRRRMPTAEGNLEIQLHVARGRIEEIRLAAEFAGAGAIADLEAALQGVRHDPAALRQALDAFVLEDYLPGVSRGTLVAHLF